MNKTILILMFLFILCIKITHADYWDQMSGISFVQPLSSPNILAYNVTVIAQSDNEGIGPSYLLNGFSDINYWYQIGISYNSPLQNTSNGNLVNHTNGFGAVYEVFDPNGTSIYPEGGGGGLLNLSGPIQSGDKVLLSLKMANGTVIMLVKDWNTNATAQIRFSSYNVEEFQGTLYAQNAGRSSGLMTEWYHNSPYYYDNGKPSYYKEEKVVYSPVGLMPHKGWLFLFKICSPLTTCLTSDFIGVVTNQGGGYTEYAPKVTQELTQADLPYNFSNNDGQSDNFYPNGTFTTGTLTPPTTISSTTTSTISTSTTTTAPTTTISTTVILTTSMIATSLTTLATTTIGNSQPNRVTTYVLVLHIAIGIIAMVVVILLYVFFKTIKRKAKPM